jgi:aminopeptidase N
MSSHACLRPLIAAGLALVAACAPLGRPGERGLGDSFFPYVGNGGYDVQHYHLALDVDPVANTLEGVAEIDAVATHDLSSFSLDLRGLGVVSVSVDGAPAAFEHEGSELVIQPKGASLPEGQAFVVRVVYRGSPAGVQTEVFPMPSGVGWMQVADEIYVLSQPIGAAGIFPCNDHPLDKASYSFEITAPEHYTVATNGAHLGSEPADEGKQRHRWRAEDPTATYLVTLAIGALDLELGSTESGLPLRHYFHEEAAPVSRDAFDATADMLAYFEEVFGPYPFESYGAILASAPFPGALETQTIPTYGAGAAHESVIAHEMAHQWFGNSVSVVDWSEIWLSEGFASYASWLWVGASDGQEAMDQTLMRTYGFVQRGQIGPPADIGRKQMFGAEVYIRGAWVLRALHESVGDETFFAILRQHHERNRNGNSSITEFVELSVELGGEEQRALLNAWLHDEKPPTLPHWDEAVAQAEAAAAAG